MAKRKRAMEEDGSSGRAYTVSMAVAGSIINNAQSQELATRLSGQIARAAAIFTIDEIVVYDDGESSSSSFMQTGWGKDTGLKTGGEFLTTVLRYLEVPQYLRLALIPKHWSLRYAGQLPPLDAPHHLRKQAWLPYREGVVVDKRAKGRGVYVDVGLDENVFIRDSITPGTRVTVNMGPTSETLKDGTSLSIVPSTAPREVAGLYWGYRVRHVERLTDVFLNCPFGDKYDYSIGTSEHGDKLPSRKLRIPAFRHLLVVFGGPAGLEEAMELDGTATTNVKDLFDRYLNTCPNQGSRTIRTEEAILISLQFFQEPFLKARKRATMNSELHL